MQHVPSSAQLADIFTKSLPQAAYYALRNKLGVVEPPTTSLRGGINMTQVQNQVKPSNNTKPATALRQEDKRALDLLMQKSCSQCTRKESIQLANRYAILSTAG